MALIEGHLLNAGTIVIHDVQIERKLVAILINRNENLFVMVEALVS